MSSEPSRYVACHYWLHVRRKRLLGLTAKESNKPAQPLLVGDAGLSGGFWSDTG